MSGDRPLTVLVLAVGGNVSQGILKSLARAATPYRVLGADVSPHQMGLHTVDRAFVSPWAADEAFLPRLLEICKAEPVDAILSGAEPVLMALARHRDTITRETGAFCLVSDLNTMDIGDDKLKTCHWLREQGINCPEFAASEDKMGLETVLAAVGFPLIAKPRRGGGARGLLLVENQDDLDYVHRKSSYVVQEYLGNDAEEYTVGCFARRDGTLTESCCMRRELLSGTTYRAELGDFPEVREEAERIVAALRPLGPCNVQLRLHNGRPVCFEINPRLSGSAPIRSHFGYNEAVAALDHFVLGREPELPRVTQGVGLRYWNELYPAPTALDELATTGELVAPHRHGAAVEAYGILSDCEEIAQREHGLSSP